MIEEAYNAVDAFSRCVGAENELWSGPQLH
jgi:hypothetical protein